MTEVTPPPRPSGRDEVLSALRRELVGPAPVGHLLELLDGAARFAAKEDSFGPWIEAETGEEVLQRDPPTRRYGVAVLYPPKVAPDPGDDLAASGGQATSADSDGLATEGSTADEAKVNPSRVADASDFDISLANSFKPSAMGLSFLVTLEAKSHLDVDITGAAYVAVPLFIGGQAQHNPWWLRKPGKASVRLDAQDLRTGERKLIKYDVNETWASLALELNVFSRPWSAPNQSLVTVTLVNRSRSGDRLDGKCLFQSGIQVTPSAGATIDPYPEREQNDEDLELAGFDLLYRNALTYAVGHGCAADWDLLPEGIRLRAEALPTYETPSITPDITLPDGSAITVPMAPLAGEVPGDDGLATLASVVEAYATWIQARKVEAAGLPSQRLRDAAARHLRECTRALTRMQRGLALLEEDEQVLRAFRLMNAAMLEQQLRSARPTRTTSVADGRFAVAGKTDPEASRSSRSWRAFQIGFMLTTLPSVADRSDPDRETVELIFFPTGGGKTEAYLGLAAVSMILRRLRDKEDVGVEVLMRYTLRLLTTQQFSRAAALICSLDQLRAANPDLGGPFRIAVWLGGGTTPNRFDDAKAALRKLNKGDRKAENPFLLLRCPWCAAQLGPLEGMPKKGPRVAGYAESGGRIVFQCPDRRCPYNSNTGLPLSVVDDDIYKNPPDFLLGTVDKFATLTWRPEARALFGIGADGTREKSPPGLIIQDELHLISGPLGSVVGLYETAIEALATDDRSEPSIKPKIVTSTATIRRFEDQAKALYARSAVRLFPPHGLDAGDSFFAQYATEPDGRQSPGRMYVGIHAPGLGSIQTAQVRTFAALLQAPVDLPDEQRDPWWTMLSFFNSLRELGTSLSLLQSDIPDYLTVMRSRYGLDWDNVRRLRSERVKELTSRLRHDEIPQAIEDLQQPYSSGEALDVCIASNIIEVGVDIDRLSVMTVVGQPKSTSQYIQVTGRVGRRWKERPGLVATIYGASKPRDRSHFEHFRSYHSRLYAQVEPTSATPFSPPVLDRALHAVLVALVRQLGPADLSSWPFDDELERQALSAIELLRARVHEVDPTEAEELERVLKYRLHQWRSWERTQWQARGTSEDQVPLLRRAGQWVPEEARILSWSTPNSMRDVDAECRIEVTSAYRRAAGEALETT